MRTRPGRRPRTRAHAPPAPARGRRRGRTDPRRLQAPARAPPCAACRPNGFGHAASLRLAVRLDTRRPPCARLPPVTRWSASARIWTEPEMFDRRHSPSDDVVSSGRSGAGRRRTVTVNAEERVPNAEERVPVAVVGAGQAGLAASHELTRAGVDHVVLERARVGETWRGRWDSFCLVTPNWTIRLPGGQYDGSDPDGFMPRDEIVAYLERYAASFPAPVREGVERYRHAKAETRAASLSRHRPATCAPTRWSWRTGAYQRAHRPEGADDPTGRSAADRRPGLPQRAGAAARWRARGRERPVRLPDRGGAARGRPRRRSRVREGGLGCRAASAVATSSGG